MKKGIYQKEAENRNPTRQPGTDRPAVRRKKAAGKRLTVIGLAVLVIIALTVTLILVNRNPIKGKWDLDGVTFYEFGNSGRGALIVPTAEYAFDYEIEENTIRLTFEDTGAKNAEYTFLVEGDTLTLTGGNVTTQGIYVLTRVDK